MCLAGLVRLLPFFVLLLGQILLLFKACTIFHSYLWASPPIFVNYPECLANFCNLHYFFQLFVALQPLLVLPLLCVIADILIWYSLRVQYANASFLYCYFFSAIVRVFLTCFCLHSFLSFVALQPPVLPLICVIANSFLWLSLRISTILLLFCIATSFLQYQESGLIYFSVCTPS